MDEELNFDIKKCECKCHDDGRIRHEPDKICCEKLKFQMASQPCKCGIDEDWHVSCAINPHFTTGKAKITDIKKSYTEMHKLQKYTGCILFGYDKNTKSLDIHFARSECEWDDGAGIQINQLTDSDKDALRQYLENGK